MTEFINFFFPLPSWSIWTVSSLFSAILGLVVYSGGNYFIESRKFRNIIFTELEGLYPTPTKWPENPADIDILLREKYPRIEIAVHQFKGNLPSCMVCGFNSAWIRYYNKYGEYRWQNYIHYTPFTSETSSDGTVTTKKDNTINYKDTFKKNVENLLKYARQT